MLQALINVFRIAELRSKILFTLGLLAIYRIGHWIPLPGVNQEELARLFEQSSQDGGPFGRAANFIAMFSGGTFSQSTVFGLGIMPYISASIIIQLLTSVYPRLKKIQEEGPTGRQKILEWTRYLTIALCIIQGMGWLKFITGSGQNLVYANWAGHPLWWVMALSALTAGTVFLMWLGEQIDKYGIGNGVSMIIMAGIVARIPFAIGDVYTNFGPGDETKMGWAGVIFLVCAFVGVVAGSVIMTVAQRRIPVQQAKHMKGKKVFGGQRSYLPLRVNHAGVMPIIFASSLMIFPSVIFGMLYNQTAQSLGFGNWLTRAFSWLSDNFQNGEFPFMVGETVMIYFFAYFWITVQFNPEEMAKQLRDHGSFIPGLRPGPRTAEYLEAVMERITFVGATMLAVIAVLPSAISKGLGVDYGITQFLGGTGMLIVVSVVLDFVQRIEANLLMRNYAGFLGAEGGSGPKIQSARSM
ncbi:MAG: preprotein translocase subunit SecY [Phycisphaerales bacterium]